MSSVMKGQDSDDEGDLEALRLAALKSRKPKYLRVNHNNLIPIVPNTVETPDFTKTKIKVEKVSPSPENNITVKKDGAGKETEDDIASNNLDGLFENNQDILSMDDKEEEDSLERLMDQLEAEISGKAPILSDKNLSEEEKLKKNKDADDEIELVQIKSGREPGDIIEIRESVSPENVSKASNLRKSVSPHKLKNSKERSRSPFRNRSRSPFRNRSRSPFSRGRSYRRSRSPYWSRSPRRSRSPFPRSRSPFWMSRRSRSTSRSPFKRYKSPVRTRSRFSRSRSRSFDRRRSPLSSPRRRSKSPYYSDGYPPVRRRYPPSPSGRSRRSITPRKTSIPPRRRSRSPRHFIRNSPYRRSKSPFRRSRSPTKRIKSPIRFSQSPLPHRSDSSISKLNSPLSRRSPHTRSPIRSKSPNRRSFSPNKRPKLTERSPSRPRSKSPKKNELSKRSRGHSLPKNGRNFSFSNSPPRRNRSTIKMSNKNKFEGTDKNNKSKVQKDGKRHRSLSRENNQKYDRRAYRQKYFKKNSTAESRNSDRQRKNSKSPSKQKELDEKKKEETSNQNKSDNETSPLPVEPVDPILEARKKKFENNSEVDPTVDKKISLKSIKESTEPIEEDEDALTINIEGNLWDESEESEDEFESRFKSSDSKNNNNRTVFSFRNLHGGGGNSVNLNKPLTEDNRRDKSVRAIRYDRWQHGKRNDRRNKTHSDESKSRRDENDRTKSRSDEKSSSFFPERRSDRKPIMWSKRDEKKSEKSLKKHEVAGAEGENKSKNSEKTSNEKINKDETDDFDKLISDFEKELESDVCISSNKVSSEEGKKPKISVKKDLFEHKPSLEPSVQKSTGIRTVNVSEISHSIEKSSESKNIEKNSENTEKLELATKQPINDGPEDYIEDDDFVLEESSKKPKNAVEEEDNSSDLRAVLSRRRNARLTKAVTLQENMPTRLVQSAFQGLGNRKSRRQIREVQDSVDFGTIDKNLKHTGGEGRRVLLLQREKNSSLPYVKCSVQEVQPDTTIYQRVARSNDGKRKRKFQMHLDSLDNMDQEEEEEMFENEGEKQTRRFRLKRKITLSTQFDI